MMWGIIRFCGDKVLILSLIIFPKGSFLLLLEMNSL